MKDVLHVRNEYRLEQWNQVIQECQTSGLNNREYCRQHGIAEKTYYYLLRKLRTDAAEIGMPQIVEMKASAATEDKVYICFRGAELTLPGGMDAEAIAAILCALQQLW